MEKLLAEIRLCQLCSKHLPHGPRPTFQASENSRILIIGQAPGKKVHESRWQAQNKWFETDLAPEIAALVAAIV